MPLFLALDRGYYKQEGLDVEIGDGSGSATTVQVVGSKGDTFGWADASVLALNVGKGVPAMMVADVLQQTPTVVMSRASKPVVKPKDLEGKKLALTTGGSAEQLFTALVAFNNLDKSKVTTVNVTSNAQTAAFLTGQVDGLITSVGTYLVTKAQAKKEGIETQVLWFAEQGVVALAHGIVVHKDTLKEQPDLVKRFVRASLRGWEDGVKDPAAPIQATIKYRRDITNDYLP